MSRIRRTSVKRNEKEIGHIRGPNGGRLCRFCKCEVKPPRRTFCSDSCVHEWKIRADIKYLRKFVYERDLGQCAKCGIDTRFTKIEIENAARDSMRESGRWNCDDHPIYLECIRKFNLTVADSKKSLWQADHIVEVADGGGEADLSNFQTLCTADHKIKSAESRRKRAKELREARAKYPIVKK